MDEKERREGAALEYCYRCEQRRRQKELDDLRMDNFVLKCLSVSLALFSFTLMLALTVG